MNTPDRLQSRPTPSHRARVRTRDAGTLTPAGDGRRARRLAAVLLCLAPGAGAEESVAFVFAPPEDTRYERRLRMDREITLGRETWTEKHVRKYRGRVTTLDGGGLLTEQPTYLDTSVDGRRSPMRVTQALLDNPVGIRLDDAARVLEVRGLDALLEEIRERIDRRLAARLAAYAPAEGLTAHRIVEWNRRVTALAGGRLAPGDEWWQPDWLMLPDGRPVLVRTTWRFRRMQRCGRGVEQRCARIDLRYQSDPAVHAAADTAYVDLLSKQIDAALRQREPPPLAPQDDWDVLLARERAELVGLTEQEPALMVADPETIRVSANGYLLIEPRTLLPHKEFLKRYLHMDVPTPTITRRVTVEETRNVEYTYD